MHKAVFWAVLTYNLQKVWSDAAEWSKQNVCFVPKSQLCVNILLISYTFPLISQRTEFHNSLFWEFLCSYVALSAVLKRATTIKRRGMDVVHRGQSGEEQYGDISSVGEWESGEAHKYGHIKV